MPQALRVVLVTDGQGDMARIVAIARAAVAGGVRAVQVREPKLSARQLGALCERLLPLLEQDRGLLLVNDRVDVAAAGLAHGAHIGHRSLPVAAARRVLAAERLLTVSAHDAEQIAEAAAGGADAALLAPVWPTTSKPDALPLGPARAGAWTASTALPTVWLGGVDARRAAEVTRLPAAQRPAGVAVRSELCGAEDPEAAARVLVAAWAGVVAPPASAQPKRPET